MTMTPTKTEILNAAFGSEQELRRIISANRDNIRDYLRLPEKTGAEVVWEKATNFLARRAGADLANNIDLLDAVTYCEELLGKDDKRVAELLRPFQEGEDLNDVYQC